MPLTSVYNRIAATAVYPKSWKVEHQIALPKNTPPQSEDDLHNIAKTPFFSKVFESIVGAWLMPFIKPHLDPGQCGRKGLSVNHYLLKFLDFVHSCLDENDPHAVLVSCIDISKAFNRVDHNLLIEDLYKMKVPAWLLKILMSYLSERTMILKVNNKVSSSKSLPAGVPQGAFLGGLIFIIKFNGALRRPSIPRIISGSKKSLTVKYVDDESVAVDVDLKKSLIPDPVEKPRPLQFRERTGHILPEENNLLQQFIHEVEDFTLKNKMVINKVKTTNLLFNRSRKYDFLPQVQFKDGELLNVVSNIKLVGVKLSDNLSWSENTNYICNKGRGQLWTLQRMKNLGFDIFTIFETYTKEIRSILEYAVPIWHSSLTR